MISVSGIESAPAFARSFPYAVSTPFCALASPNSPIVKPGWARCAPATASRTGWILSAALVLSPRIWKSTSAACRFPEIAPRRTCCATVSFETAPITSSITAAKATSPTRAERLSIRTLSCAGCLKPASRILSMRPDWPVPALASMFLVPTRPPSPKATTTKASQPKVAFFQWAALQRPIRAAKLEWCGLLDMLVAPFRSIAPTLRAGCSAVVGAEWESGSDSKTISAPTQVGGRPPGTARMRNGHAAAGPRRCPDRAAADSRR